MNTQRDDFVQMIIDILVRYPLTRMYCTLLCSRIGLDVG